MILKYREMGQVQIPLRDMPINTMHLKHGVEAVFIPTQWERVGIKMYAHLSDAQAAIRSQNEAYRYNIGPEVLSKCQEYHLDKDYKIDILWMFFPPGISFGYLTRIVTVDAARVTQAVLADITKQGQFLSYMVNDIHEHNVGYIGDHLVLIDFGGASVVCEDNTYIRLPNVNTDIIHPKRKHRTPQMEKDIKSIFRMKGLMT